MRVLASRPPYQQLRRKCGPQPSIVSLQGNHGLCLFSYVARRVDEWHATRLVGLLSVPARAAVEPPPTPHVQSVGWQVSACPGSLSAEFCLKRGCSKHQRLRSGSPPKGHSSPPHLSSRFRVLRVISCLFRAEGRRGTRMQVFFGQGQAAAATLLSDRPDSLLTLAQNTI